MTSTEACSRRLTFLTMSFGTRWEAYSQALIRSAFPHARAVVLNGTHRWHALQFLDAAMNYTTDYVVHVDEDAFLLDGAQLAGLIATLDGEPDVAVCGTPDGGTFHRDHNPVACNPFFLVMRTSCIRDAVAREPLSGHPRFAEEMIEPSGVRKLDLDWQRVSFDDFEPYYPLFWSVLRAGYRTRYLLPRTNRELLSSDIHIGDASSPMLRHMWWIRRWNDPTPDAYLGVVHADRYRRFEQQLLRERAGDRRFAQALATADRMRRLRGGAWWARRVVSRNIERIGRRLGGRGLSRAPRS